MSRRERLERKKEKREEWAVKRKADSEREFKYADSIVQSIPLGQPILIGHHSEKSHRATLRRMDGAMRRGCEKQALASRHRSAAAGIQRALDTSIFSDDANAIQELEERIAAHEQTRKVMRETNAAWRKAKKPSAGTPEWATVVVPRVGEKRALECARTARLSWEENAPPFPKYALSNLGGRITADRKRIKEIERRADTQRKAEESGGVLISSSPDHDYCSVTFSEKPDRDIINAMKEAGFYWSGGSWQGQTPKIPAVVLEMAGEA